MDQHAQFPLVTRGRILLFALLSAFVWLLLSIFTGGTTAVADERDDGLLESLTSTVEEVVPLTIVTETLNDVTESLAPVTNAVAPATDPLTPVVEPITQTTQDVLEPVLEQPAIEATVTLVNDVVGNSIDALTGVEIDDPLNFEPLSSAMALPLAATAFGPGPAAVKATAVTPDTRAASVPAAGSLSSPQSPSAPTDPVIPAPAPSLGQASGAPALVAALAHAGGPLTLVAASAASASFAAPASPTFDHDSSPD